MTESKEQEPRRPAPPETLTDDEIFPFVELLFFAYRDFVGDPDAILAKLNFGRAHHRVLHFVARYPGLRVTDLLTVLQITKQSLARVLKQLVVEGYIMQEPGAADRRERLLYLTGKGRALSERLAAPQLERVRQALAAAGPEAADRVGRFLNHMISQNGRDEAARFLRPKPVGDRAGAGRVINGAAEGRSE